MNFSWVKTNWLIKKLFSNYVWDIPNHENKVYLTFDDGPTPAITEWTLAQLKLHDAKATFFCIGDNVRKFPEIFQKVISEGHSIGNHTFNHLNGWKTKKEVYVKNVELCNQEIAESRRQKAESSIATKSDNLQSELFRPPYGKIKPSQSKILRKQCYKIIMWDIISYDFDATISPEKCLDNVLKNVQSGSIIVFHDSKKAFTNLEFALPRTLQFLKENGFVCDAL
ncbi:polysaccharide deacetylase family protein [Flavobacterium sp.]|uniref:polysaccharide deacetylase family protein n=1 Tax=Flavobacterium sp. TaxID=239 RepID=UPI002B4B25FB|nr:polysaccharide deacetylase family protein [Flavobacterium sp.]HLP62905.1 polysaccharide deacetylase family protein [Flavobacterium sp.]